MIELFIFILGTVFGSFLNVCIYRLPRNESIVFPPSRCTSCNSRIKPYHNIPVFAYLYLRGKCSECGEKISPFYPSVELISGILAFLLYTRYGFTIDFIFYSLLAFALIAITFIDLEHMIIPNIITFPGIAAGVFFSMIKTEWSLMPDILKAIDLSNIAGIISSVPVFSSVFGMILGGGILFSIAYVYQLLRKVEGMGMGDVKLLAMLGAFLGPGGVVFIIFVSSLLGTLVGITLMIRNKGDLKYAIPYGPFLSLAAIIFMFTGSLNNIIEKLIQP